MLKPVSTKYFSILLFPRHQSPLINQYSKGQFRRLFSSFLDLRYLSVPSLKTQSHHFERQAVSNYLQICKRQVKTQGPHLGLFIKAIVYSEYQTVSRKWSTKIISILSLDPKCHLNLVK